MPLLQLNVAPSTKDLRWFAGLWWPVLCALVGITLIRKWHLPGVAVGFWLAAAILAVGGLVSPPVIQGVYNAVLRLSYPFGFVLSYVLLFAVYFLVFTPLGALVRLFHDPMSRKLDRAAASYWTAHQPDPMDRYFRQF